MSNKIARVPCWLRVDPEIKYLFEVTCKQMRLNKSSVAEELFKKYVKKYYNNEYEHIAKQKLEE